MNNFHTHTYRCLHAYGSEEDYVLSAIKRGTQQLGFSDHAPFPDRDFGLRMSYDELDDYLQTIERLSQVYDGTIRLYKGLEIEFYQEYIDYYRMLLDEKQLDYLALGAHTRFDDKGALKNIFFDYMGAPQGRENYCGNRFTISGIVMGRNFLTNNADIEMELVMEDNFSGDTGTYALGNKTNRLSFLIAPLYNADKTLTNDFYRYCQMD